jgi:cupin 2 domain-containing protein
MEVFNLYHGVYGGGDEEVHEALLEGETTRIQRIISNGQASPSDFWYDQDEHEWVIVLLGRAGIRFEEDNRLVELGPGDSLNIPAHARHRVAWTSTGEPTVWLAVFYR